MDLAFRIEGKGLEHATLVGFRGSEQLSRCFAIETFVTVPDSSVLDGTLGANLSLWFDQPEAYALHGVATEIELLLEVPERTLARIRLTPRFSLLGLSHHSRMFTGRSVPEVIQAVLTKAGLAEGSDFEFRLTNSYAPEEHVCQYQESDLAFIERWLEYEGIHYFFEHQDGCDKLVMRDDSLQHATLRDAPVRYHPVGKGDVSAGESFRRFSAQRSSRPSKITLVDYDCIKPDLDVSGSARALPGGFGEVALFGDDRFSTADRGKALAGLRAESELALQSSFHAEGTALQLRPGYGFELTGHLVPKLDDKYLCVELEHHANTRVTTGEYARLTGLGTHEVYHARILAIPATTKFRPTRRQSRPRIHGYLTGIVDGPATSDYAQLDDQGRYQISLHLDESGLKDGNASTWLRMMQPHAGNPEGMHFPLRKGTEVMVAFLDGDPDRPLIVGAVPNAHNPSAVTSTNDTHNVIHTGGDNRFDFEDLKDGQWITFSSPTKDTYLHLGHPIDERTHRIVMHTDGDCLFDYGSNQDIQVGGTLDEVVEGAVKELYQAKQTSLVTGKQSTTVTGACEETYHSTQSTLTIGQVTEDYQVEHATTVNAAPRREAFLGSQTTTVSGGGLTEQLNGAHSRTVVGPSTSTLASYDRHVTGDTTLLYPASATRIWGPNTATFKSLDLTIPGGVVAIHARHQVNVPKHVTSNLIKFELGPSKTEVCYVWSGGCALKLEACDLAIAGTACKVEFVGAAVVINGFAHSWEAEEIETHAATELNLIAFLIKV